MTGRDLGRRQFVAGLTAILAGLAGCPGDTDTGDGSTDEGSPTTDASSVRPTATLSPTATPSPTATLAPTATATTEQSATTTTDDRSGTPSTVEMPAPTATPTRSPTLTETGSPGTPTATPASADPFSDGAKTGHESFGQSIAMSDETILVGANAPDDSVDDAAAYFFERRDGEWTIATEVTPTETGTNRFGRTVALEGDTGVIGSAHRLQDGTEVAAVVIYERSDGEWSRSARLVFDEWHSQTNVCRSVALSGDIAVVGATTTDESESDDGTAYLLERSDDGNWTQTAVLTPDSRSDGEETPTSDGVATGGVGYGKAVAILSNSALVAGRGACYGYERTDGTWEQTEIFEGPRKPGHEHAQTVALEEETALISYESRGAGVVHVLRRQPVGWKEQPRILGDDWYEYDSFGYAMAIEGTTAVIGAPIDVTESGRTGTAFVYERRDGEWSRTVRLVPADGRPGDTFGAAVGISGSTVVVSAPATESDASGSAYVFEL